MKKLLLLSIFVFLLFIPAGQNALAATFTDIGDTHRAKTEINYLAEENIVHGKDGLFLPDNHVTRAEAAAMIGRALKLDGTKRETSFPDVPESTFASGYIEAAVEKEIIRGYEDGSFKPDNPVKRGEMALLINRAFEFGGKTTVEAAQKLMDIGIAQGISKTDFGFDQQIKRSDFAVFLARSINLDLRLTPSFNDQQAAVTVDVLNIRSGPSTDFPIVGVLKQDDVISIAYRINEWAYINNDAVQGFVHTDYIGPVKVSDEGKPDAQLPMKTIVIDPGHGAHQPGAKGFGILEKDVVLDTSLRLKKYFINSPFNVKLTRETDTFLELEERVAFAKKHNADIFISVHANATNGIANGTETFFYAAYQNPNIVQSKALATYIQDRLLTSWKLTNRGIKKGDYHVIRENTMPAVLVELGFIDHKGDNDKLRSPEWREEAARAMYLGILDYYYHYEKLDVISLYHEQNAAPSAKLH